MKESVNKLKVFLFAAMALTAICIVLFTLSMFFAFDSDVEYFKTNSPLTYIQTAVAVVSVLFFLSIAFFIPKGSLTSNAPANVVLTVFSSLICGFIYISGMILFYISTAANAAGMTGAVRYIFIGIVASGIIGAAYFIYDALSSNKNGLPIKTFLALFVIINLILTVVFEHLDYYVAINTPRKTLLFLSFIFNAMFIVQELRFKAGIGQPRAYFFFGATSMLLSGILSIPHIIAHYAGIMRDSSFLIYYLIALVLAFYSMTRLLSYTKLAEYEAKLKGIEPPAPESEGEESNEAVDEV